MLDGAVDRGKQAGAALPHAAVRLARQRVERAGLDQALEHALVHQAEVDVLTERVERIEAPELAAHRQE